MSVAVNTIGKAEKEEEIWQVIQEQESTMESLDEVINALEQRLAPILYQQDQGNKNETSTERSSALGERLELIHVRTREEQERLARIIERLAI